MRRIHLIPLLLVAVLVISGCSLLVEQADDSASYVEFFEQSGVIAEKVTDVTSEGLLVGYTVAFNKTAGDLNVTIKDSNGKEYYNDALVFGNFYPNRPEDELPSPEEEASEEYIEKIPHQERLDWGYFSVRMLSETQGTYTITIEGTDASGTLGIIESNSVVEDFTGIIEVVEFEAEKAGQTIPIAFTTGSHEKGDLIIRVIDPQGEQVRSKSMEKPQDFFIMDKESKSGGVYSAYIEAEDATAVARGVKYTEKQIPALAFILPGLLMILGIIALLLVKKENRKLMIWGAMYWLIAYFLGGILGELLGRSVVSVLDIKSMTYLVFVIIMQGILPGLLMGIIPLFSGMVKDIKSATPSDLAGFAAGFVMAAPIMEGVGGFMNIYRLSTQTGIAAHNFSIPGTYPTSGAAFLATYTTILSRIGLMAVLFALVVLILWAMRQKTRQINKWVPIVFGVLGIAVSVTVYTYLIRLPFQGNFDPVYTQSFNLGSVPVQANIITTLFIVATIIIWLKRGRIVNMLNEACQVTIDDIGKRKQESA
ncbi:MAG TPA: hypothetical protein PKV16_06080 [Caldisericia bacterium]|nr:hypothetical protein [Caldisericia bacterium]HPF49243.1 hypothetical protein [Caldisericia bacterium]HPI84077.1 hypothetical protein [Caldisericia bacterium]HPQ93335.1 hypothetical protein [Caldisericia bacterium]HRV75283.1 hypothetical protein [Caldisericia bacterium]